MGCKRRAPPSREFVFKEKVLRYCRDKVLAELESLPVGAEPSYELILTMMIKTLNTWKPEFTQDLRIENEGAGSLWKIKIRP